MEKVIAIFDIGKTNKKILLFNQQLNLVHEQEEIFPTITDEDGVECDDIEKIEKWIASGLADLTQNPAYDIKAVNFATYGASLAYLDAQGKRITPIYNYLKDMPEGIVEPLYEKYGGKDEFCRCTASPASGMLNSGFQALWLKHVKPEVFKNVATVLHFPQYLSYLLTKKTFSEYTSIGCHTSMWDFDKKQYHQWMKDENIHTPQPTSNSETIPVNIVGKTLQAGIGIHDSSASLAPYIINSNKKFLLLSTGTWCISMNPFNEEPLTAEQLASDCLCYMSISQNPVKSSRLFMGRTHDQNTERVIAYFGVPKNTYKTVKPDTTLLKSLMEQPPVFFKDGVPENLVDESVDLSVYKTFEDAYHQLMVDISRITMKSISLILASKDDTEEVYISGGFAKSALFTRIIATFLKDKKVYTSEISNSTALGAALVVYGAFENPEAPKLDLGLELCLPF